MQNTVRRNESKLTSTSKYENRPSMANRRGMPSEPVNSSIHLIANLPDRADDGQRESTLLQDLSRKDYG